MNKLNGQSFIVIQLDKDEFNELIKEAISEVLSTRMNQNEKGDRLLKIEDVCDLLKVSKVTIHKWKKNGLIPFHRISKRIFFKEAEIFQAIEKK